MRNFEIKILKTSVYLKSFGQNRFKKSVVFHPKKIKQVLAIVKIEKN
jgi:hypothetical protein